jgi:nickel-dependent lactate racemase
MKIRLAFGKTGLEVELADDLDITIIEPSYAPGIPDEGSRIRESLIAPIESPALPSFVQRGDRVGVVISDITRPAPSQVLLPVILETISHVPMENIIIFVALGTHRSNTAAELESMLGPRIVECFQIIQNNAFDLSEHISFGTSSFGHEIWLNRELMECDVRILTGFIEPHFFAGFSGGGKAIMPGMAGQPTVLANHSAEMIDDPCSTWGQTKENPIWEEIHEVATSIERTFLVNVTLNRDKQITGIFSGNLLVAHEEGSQFVRNKAMTAVTEPFDIVITSNSGYPLDLNLYQAVKGMSAAAQIVREGGAIIIAADCWDGIPDHGSYGKFLKEAGSPERVLEQIRNSPSVVQDQWQAQMQALIQQHADVFVHTNQLSETEIESCLLSYSPKVETTLATLMGKYGGDARICVLPEGPQTIPYLKNVSP